MIDKVRKGLLISLGAASLAKKEIEKHVKVLVKTEKITEAQGKRLASKFLKEGMKQQARIRKIVNTELDRIAKAARKA
ncbi:hypothetical protein JXA85_05555 [Candidatus Woesearchaeota archaeon]|nr:hypothetical protein [Candidatus Woesearchaeota archaeon]